MITIITLAFIVTLYIKTIKEQYVIKYAKSPRDYYSIFFDNFNSKCKILEDGTVLNFQTNKNITNEYKSLEKFYNQLSTVGGFSFFGKKRNFLLNIFVKWLEFYIFLLNLFLIILTFSYFLYFGINFQLGDYTLSPTFIYGVLLFISTMRFYQNYYILLKIKNNLNLEILAVSTFIKINQKFFFFNFSENKNFMRWVIRWIFPILSFFIFLLINCRIISIIYCKIYFKKTISLFTLFSKISFGPILGNFILVNNYINYNFYYLFNYFINIFLLLTLVLLIFICLSFYFRTLLYIVTEPFTKSDIIQLKYNDFILLPETQEKKLINALQMNIQNFENSYNEIKPSSEYHIVWFKNLKFYLKQNYKLYGPKKFIFYVNNLYIILGSVLGVILLLLLTLTAFTYYKLYLEINLFQLLFLPLITIQKRFMFRRSFQNNIKKTGPSFFSRLSGQPNFSSKNEPPTTALSLDLQQTEQGTAIKGQFPRDMDDKQMEALDKMVNLQKFYIEATLKLKTTAPTDADLNKMAQEIQNAQVDRIRNFNTLWNFLPIWKRYGDIYDRTEYNALLKKFGLTSVDVDAFDSVLNVLKAGRDDQSRKMKEEQQQKLNSDNKASSNSDKTTTLTSNDSGNKLNVGNAFLNATAQTVVNKAEQYASRSSQPSSSSKSSIGSSTESSTSSSSSSQLPNTSTIQNPPTTQNPSTESFDPGIS
jgi:hypothetical protein